MNMKKCLFIIIVVMIIPQISFAKSNLKTRISNFFQKMDKKTDDNSSKTNSKTANIKPQTTSVPTIVASTTKKLTLEDFDLLPQEQVKIKKIFTQKFLDKFDTENVRYWSCQGFTTDDEYFYVALLSFAMKKEIDKERTKILKIRINDCKIVEEKDLGTIGHSNSLTYNPKTKKIYASPYRKEWSCIYEFDTDLNNLKKINLYNNDDSIIKNKEFISFSYFPTNNQYILVYGNFLLGLFDSNFKLINNLKISMSLFKTTNQAISTDGINIFSVTNEFFKDKVKSNLILVYDKYGNYIDKYEFEQELGVDAELEQISFANGKCYGLTCYYGTFHIYEITLKKVSEEEQIN